MQKRANMRELVLSLHAPWCHGICAIIESHKPYTILPKLTKNAHVANRSTSHPVLNRLVADGWTEKPILENLDTGRTDGC